MSSDRASPERVRRPAARAESLGFEPGCDADSSLAAKPRRPNRIPILLRTRPIYRCHSTFHYDGEVTIFRGSPTPCPSESASVLRYLPQCSLALSPLFTVTFPRFRG